MRALVVDPGKLTGYGLLEWHESMPLKGIEFVHAHEWAVSFSGGEMPMDDFIDYASRTIRPALVDFVITETFDVRADTQQKVGGGPLWSSEQIGVMRAFARWGNIPFIEQTPADMKSFDANKEKTKVLGWWQDRRPNEKGHRRDAASHALLFAVRRNLIDPRRFL